MTDSASESFFSELVCLALGERVGIVGFLHLTGVFQ